MIPVNQTEQDRVTLNPESVETLGSVSSEEQLKMDTAIANWWYCYGEARRTTASNGESTAASHFYQTVDGEFLPR